MGHKNATQHSPSPFGTMLDMCFVVHQQDRGGGGFLEIVVGWVSNPPPPLLGGWDVSGILGGSPFYPLSAAVCISRHNMKKNL